ncbi:MAG: CDF family Co(II)/Ni(II) efflux transporter DmeF [Neisseriaceae bacterium]
MDQYSLSNEYFDHDFGNGDACHAESRTQLVALLTLATMGVEIGIGWWSGSMALLADGVHMGAHALALGLSTLAYRFTRKFAKDRSFSWGSGKINGLVAYTNALFLLLTVGWIFLESADHLLHPVLMHYKEAAAVAFLGLLVNLLSVFILIRGLWRSEKPQHVGHTHVSGVDHQHDSNFQAVLIHVLADSLTSVAALLGIIAAWNWGWNWLDPLIGLVASAVILKWTLGLLSHSTSILLDREANSTLRNQVVTALKRVNPSVDIADLHIWAVAPKSWVVVAMVKCPSAYSSERYRQALAEIELVHHPIVEVVTTLD